MSDSLVPLTPFGRYVRLYTLHRVEHPADLLLVYVRIETLRYSYAPLASMPLDSVYSRDPSAGVALVNETVLPRLHALLDTRDPFRTLGLEEGAQMAWQRYAAQRGLPAEPVRMPPLHVPMPAPRLSARSKTAQRLARVQQALEMLQTAADTAATLAATWQNWQIGREQRKLLEAQRVLLHDTVRTQITGQTEALDRALDRRFVHGYLAEHAGDTVIDAVFGNEHDEPVKTSQ